MYAVLLSTGWGKLPGTQTGRKWASSRANAGVKKGVGGQQRWRRGAGMAEAPRKYVVDVTEVTNWVERGRAAASHEGGGGSVRGRGGQAVFYKGRRRPEACVPSQMSGQESVGWSMQGGTVNRGDPRGKWGGQAPTSGHKWWPLCGRRAAGALARCIAPSAARQHGQTQLPNRAAHVG